MELPPGLLPDTPTARRSWLPGLVAVFALAAVGACGLQISRLSRERDDARRRADELGAELRKRPEPAPAPPKVEPPPAPVLAPEPPPPPPPPAPAVVVAPPPAPAPVDPAPERIAQGLHDFRAARYGEAERRFFRALPDSYVYLALCGLAQRNFNEAFGFLSRAIVLDPDWLLRVKPRDLFASDLAYDEMAAPLEERLAKDPLDVEAKLLLAYLRFHDKGAPYAKALVLEVATAKPDLEEAKRFLEVLER